MPVTLHPDLDPKTLTDEEVIDIRARARLHEMMIEADPSAYANGSYKTATKWRALATRCNVELERRRAA